MISQTAEYALRIVVWLASRHPRRRPPARSRDATHIPPGYLAKVLQNLGRGGLVNSQRGLHGGFTLAAGSGGDHAARGRQRDRSDPAPGRLSAGARGTRQPALPAAPQARRRHGPHRVGAGDDHGLGPGGVRSAGRAVLRGKRGRGQASRDAVAYQEQHAGQETRRKVALGRAVEKLADPAHHESAHAPGREDHAVVLPEVPQAEAIAGEGREQRQVCRRR